MTAQRIVIAMHDFFRGGTERVSLTFARLWTDMGRDVTILCGSTDGGLRDQVDARVPVVVVDPPMHRGPLSRFRLGRLMGAELARLRPDLVYLPGNFHMPLARGMRRSGYEGLIVQKVSNPTLPAGIAGAFVKPFYRFYAQSLDGFAAMNHGLAREAVNEVVFAFDGDRAGRAAAAAPGCVVYPVDRAAGAAEGCRAGAGNAPGAERHSPRASDPAGRWRGARADGTSDYRAGTG